MSDVRRLGFSIGWNINRQPIVQANKETDRFRSNVLGATTNMNGLGFQARNTNNQITKGFEGVNKTLKNVVKVGMGLVITGFGAIGAAATKSAITQEESLKTIRVGTGATGRVLNNLMDSYENVGRSATQNLGITATVLADLNTRTGLTGKALERLSTTTLELGRITDEDLGGIVTNTTRVFGDWGIAADKTSETLDKLFITSQNTGIGIGQLSSRLVQYGAPLRQMGFSFEQSAALMGKFEKEGVNTELVLGSLRIALGKMSQDGIKDTSKGLQLITKRIKEAGTVGKANALAIEAFGARSGPDMAAAIREGRFEIKNLITTIENSTGAIKQNAKESLTLGERFSMLRNNASIALAPIGASFIELGERIIPQAITAVESMSNIFSSSGGKRIEGIVNLRDMFGADFTDVIVGTIDFIKNDFIPLVRDVVPKALKGIGTGLKVVKDNAKILEPTLWGLVAGFTALKTVTMVTTAFTVLAPIVSNVGFAIAAVAGGAATLGEGLLFIMGPVGWAIGAFSLLVAGGVALYRNWDTIKEKALGLWSNITTVFTSIRDSIIGGFNSAIGFVQSIFPGWVSAIGEYIGSIKQTFTGLLGFVTGVFTGNWGKAWTGVLNVFGGIFKGIGGLAKAPINGVSDLINKFIGGINRIEIDIPDWLGKIPGVPDDIGGKKFGFNIPKIPMLALGTNNFVGGSAIVGERGPELVTLPRGSQVTPYSETRDMFRKMISPSNTTNNTKNANINLYQTNNFNIQGSNNVEENLRKIMDEISRKFPDFMEDYIAILARKMGYNLAD